MNGNCARLFGAATAVALLGLGWCAQSAAGFFPELAVAAATVAAEGSVAVEDTAAAEDKVPTTLEEVAKVLASARAAMSEGRLGEAETLLKKAEKANPKYPVLHFGDTPVRVRRDLTRLIVKQGGAEKGEKATRTPLAGKPLASTPAASSIAKQPTKDGASQLAGAEPPHAAVPEADPALNASKAAREQVQQVLGQARAAIKRGDLATAERISRKLESLKIPEDQFAPTDDRPSKLAFDLRRAALEKQAVQPAAAQVPDFMRFPGEPAPSRGPETPRLAQSQRSQPLPLPAAEDLFGAEPSRAFDLLKSGEKSLQDGNRAEALRLFKEAYKNRNELDVLSQQRLQGHLQMLSPSGGSSAQGGLLGQAGANQNVLARQLSAEVGKRQSEASSIREKDPMQSLRVLNETRELIRDSALDTETRTQLLRRIDLSLADTKQYIDDHSAELELDEANRQVLEEIERRNAVKAQVRERMAEMVDQFNSLRDEHRYAEMEVVAKRLYEMAPEEPVAQQVWQNAKFIRREMLNKDIIARAEEGFAGSMLDVRLTSADALLGSTQEISYGADWPDLVRGRRAPGDTDRRRPLREIQIQKKLQTPVLPRYNEMPLSQVVEGLSQLTGVNIHLDPRGLEQEGVSASEPVSLTLNQEISLESVLNLVLEPLHLTYMIKDEVLKITSEQLRDGDVYTKTYDVADLVIPIPNFIPSSNIGLQGLINDAYASMGYAQGPGVPGPVAMVADSQAAPAGMTGGANALAQQLGAGSISSGGSPMGGGPGGLGAAANADFDSLIDLIVSTVEHDSWMENGTGEGEIQPFPTNLSLVISQTQRVHEQISDLLEQLRRLQDLQVTIEVRFIRLQDDFFERIGIDFDFDIEDGSGITDLGGGDTATTPFEPTRASASVGISNSGGGASSFTADLDVPFSQDSFALTTPTIGGQTQAISTFGFAILSDIEAFFLIEASQGDSRMNMLNAPKVTLLNGQQGIVVDSSFVPFVISVIPVVGEFAAAQQPVIVVLSEGTMMTVQAVVSDDRRYVRLTLVPFFSQIGNVDTFTFEGSTTSSSSSGSTDEDDDGNDESSDGATETITSGTTVQLPTFEVISVSTTVSVPDGGTVLLGGIKRLDEARTEFGVPILSKVPYIDRLFRNVGIGRSTDSLMMMVTPRIIIQEEEEERLGIATE
ncbi:MAG: hypothetical protein AAGA92_11270 [Planctomycetota bacterium]